MSCVFALACNGSEAGNPPRIEDRPRGDSDKELCATMSEFALSAQTPLGFSGGSILELVRGRFSVPIRWATECDHACSVEKPCSAPADTTGLVATQTVLQIAVEPASDKALVRHATDGQPSCAEDLRVPVHVRLSSSDGAFADELIAAQVWSESGKSADVSFERAVSELKGSLSAPTRGLPSSAKLSMVFGYYEQNGGKFWLETELWQPVTPADSESSSRQVLLMDLLLPTDQCTLDLPIAQVR
jgi:hypothetical protein